MARKKSGGGGERLQLEFVFEAKNSIAGAKGRTPGTVSCVVDSSPHFQLELFRWFATATECAAIAPERMVVHAVAPGYSEALRFVESRGVRVEIISSFDDRSPHCNKIAGALALARNTTRSSGPVALTDTDMLIMSDPTTVSRGPGTIHGKTVDLSNPPPPVLEKIFRIAGLRSPDLTSGPHSTFLGNLNGGLYVLDSSDLLRVSEAWARWARWLLDRLALLGEHRIHIDQVAMCLAIGDEQVEVDLLDRSWNLPTHLDDWLPDELDSPRILHYHRRVTSADLVAEIDHPIVDAVIRRANSTISSLLAESFPETTFWSWRFEDRPLSESGIGEPRLGLEQKQRLVSDVVEMIDPQRVIDVGCGDAASVEHLALNDYVGLDISSEAITLARRRQPRGLFFTGDPTAFELGADLVLCLDVLIYQAEADAYRRLAAWVVEATDTALLISGFDNSPASIVPTVAFHEPLITTLRAIDPTLKLIPLHRSGDITTYLATRPTASRNAGVSSRRGARNSRSGLRSGLRSFCSRFAILKKNSPPPHPRSLGSGLP